MKSVSMVYDVLIFEFNIIYLVCYFKLLCFLYLMCYLAASLEVCLVDVDCHFFNYVTIFNML